MERRTPPPLGDLIWPVVGVASTGRGRPGLDQIRLRDVQALQRTHLGCRGV